MNRNYYIFKSGTLQRKDNNIRVVTEDKIKKDIPCETVSDLYLFGEINMNTKLLNFLAQKKIWLHVFNYYGFYSGSFSPREQNVSGFLLVKQVEHYADYDKRLVIAKKFIDAASYNIYRNVRYYNGRGINLERVLNEISSLRRKLNRTKNIEEYQAVRQLAPTQVIDEESDHQH